MVSNDHELAAQPRDGRGSDLNRAARPTARRHDGVEHHRAEPRQQVVEARLGESKSRVGKASGSVRPRRQASAM